MESSILSFPYLKKLLKNKSVPVILQCCVFNYSTMKILFNYLLYLCDYLDETKRSMYSLLTKGRDKGKKSSEEKD